MNSPRQSSIYLDDYHFIRSTPSSSLYQQPSLLLATSWHLPSWPAGEPREAAREGKRCEGQGTALEKRLPGAAWVATCRLSRAFRSGFLCVVLKWLCHGLRSRDFGSWLGVWAVYLDGAPWPLVSRVLSLLLAFHPRSNIPQLGAADLACSWLLLSCKLKLEKRKLRHPKAESLRRFHTTSPCHKQICSSVPSVCRAGPGSAGESSSAAPQLAGRGTESLHSPTPSLFSSLLSLGSFPPGALAALPPLLPAFLAVMGTGRVLQGGS